MDINIHGYSDGGGMELLQTKLSDKLKDASKAVLPIIGIVLLLSFSIAPMPPGILLLFLFGAVLLVVGMMFFTLGAELSMTPMGEKIGTKMANIPHISIILLLCFTLGFIITISEPDLQVLAELVPAIPNRVLILAVAAGVGMFLMIAMLRMLFSQTLAVLLFVFYSVVFVMTYFIPKDFLTVAFDSGGVTTGPMTVPFIMALGIGFAAVRSDQHAEEDSFGLVALCSVGPIVAVLVLGLLYHPEDTGYIPEKVPEIQNSVELWQCFVRGFPQYIREIAFSLLPITVFFAVFQIVSLRFGKKTLLKILIGIFYTYIGLVLFLTGVNVGFLPAGNYLGKMIAELPYRVILIPIGMVIGFFIVKAEPAVYVLMEQVEEITSGAISGRAMGLSLSLGVAFSVGLAMARVLTGISLLWFILPGYLAALCLSVFVPKIFTAIAFDSGGVASGPMTATFLLPFAMGACQALGRNIVQDAFGIIAMVAMTPLIAIQVLGAVYQWKSRQEAASESYLDIWEEDDIIEL